MPLAQVYQTFSKVTHANAILVKMGLTSKFKVHVKKNH